MLRAPSSASRALTRSRSRSAALAPLAVASALVVMVAPRNADAEPLRGKLVVTRAPGAERCPDELELRALVESVAGAPVLSSEGEPEVLLDVHITASGTGFVGVVTASGARAGTRTIDDAGSDCSVLGGAIAITIAILLEVGPDAPPPKVAEPKVAEPKVPWFRRYYTLPGIDAPPAERTKREDIPPLTGSLGALFDVGRLDGAAGGLTLGADVVVPYVSFGLALVSLPEDRVDFRSASVRYRYLGARLRACSRQPSFEQFGVGLCSGLALGERHGKVVDPGGSVPRDDQSGGYVGLNFHLDLSRRVAGPFGLYADFGLDVPLLEDPLTLTIPGVSGKIRTPDEPVVFGLGLGVRFWLEKFDQR